MMDREGGSKTSGLGDAKPSSSFVKESLSFIQEKSVSSISLLGEYDSLGKLITSKAEEDFNSKSGILTDSPGHSEVTSKEKEGVVTEQHLKDIAHELGLIKLCWTDIPVFDYDDRYHYPPSYLKNSKKEKLLLWYAENFRQQFVFKYPNRRPLLIACNNECGIQKMVCTTIRPTSVKFPELQTWQGCATFLAEHLTYEELVNPTILPDHIKSPQTVLRRQAGHCFEFTTLLASFLIASGYDAYVVSGYATREICQMDQSRAECPYLPDEPPPSIPKEPEEDIKYALKEPPILKSQLLQEIENKEIQKQKEIDEARELAEIAAIKEFEKPWPDELSTWRLHSWVLILPSKDVTEPFFIESTTGAGKSTDDPDYHGIESLWNNHNYWVNVQFETKTVTCQDIQFNLNDPQLWERFLIGEPINYRVMPGQTNQTENEEVVDNTVAAEKHMDMPASWVDTLRLSHSDYEARYARAKKVHHYRKTISEQFASYSHTDGLVTRVVKYHDYEYFHPKLVREEYKYRKDKMLFCERVMADNSIREVFGRGREDALKEHLYYARDTGIEGRFTLTFYHEARLDGLAKLEMDPLYMTIYFENREDFLYYTHVNFAERVHADQPFRVIIKITEKFHRNPNIDAAKDVAMVEFLYKEKKLKLKFHYENLHISHGDRVFLKPSYTERGARLSFDPNLTHGYSTGVNDPPHKHLYLYRLEVEWFKREEIAEKKVRERENELHVLLRLRTQELSAPRLIVSEFDIERNSEAKASFKERERLRVELEEKEKSMICDFLAPYYAKLGIHPESILPSKIAIKMMEECLQDWKNVLVARANDIQQQFETMCQDFYDKGNWYEENQSTITKEQEEQYFDYCKRNSFYLHVLEIRLNRHKEQAPARYLHIQNLLHNDYRLVKGISRLQREKYLAATKKSKRKHRRSKKRESAKSEELELKISINEEFRA